MALKKVYDGTLNDWIEIEVDNTVNEEAEKETNIQLKRHTRNMALEQTDWTMASDTPFTAEQKEEITSYRQALRDLPAQEGFPDVEFPTKPNFL
tara:strand:- start:622 stop:903 length:282 start_codon:yes stop_codon:yes gene_type:complete